MTFSTATSTPRSRAPRCALCPPGAVSLKQAWAWLLAQCLVGLGVLLALPDFAKLVALGAIPMVALYPLMKRITWWPQVWLGLTFNWGVLVAAAAARGAITTADVLLYGALIFWTLGYDTIYAIQDREDDALIGVRSTARRFGDHIKPAVGGHLHPQRDPCRHRRLSCRRLARRRSHRPLRRPPRPAGHAP